MLEWSREFFSMARKHSEREKETCHIQSLYQAKYLCLPCLSPTKEPHCPNISQDHTYGLELRIVAEMNTFGGTPWLNSVNRAYVWFNISFCWSTVISTGFWSIIIISVHKIDYRPATKKLKYLMGVAVKPSKRERWKINCTLSIWQ